jgi:hypothetical protein
MRLNKRRTHVLASSHPDPHEEIVYRSAVMNGERKATGYMNENYGVSVEQLLERVQVSRGRDQAMSHCVFDEVNRRMDVELFHDLGLVKLNGTMRNLQLVGDFFCGQPLGH